MTRFAEITQRTVELSPEDRGPRYNLACACARQGDTRRALAELTDAVRLGYQNADWASQDTDLRSLHNLPEFEALLAEMRRIAAAKEGA